MQRLTVSSLTAASLALAPTVLVAQEQNLPIVSEVEIIGPVKIHPDLIRLQLKTSKGRRFNVSELREDERAITLMDQFMLVNSAITQQADNTIKVIFTVKELPYVGSVTFAGIGYWDRSDLPNKIKTRQGGYLNPFVLEADRKKLIQHFRKERFAAAKINVAQHIDPATGFVDVTFQIDLGQKVKVDQVHYNGLPEDVHAYFLNKIITNGPSAIFNTKGFQKPMLRWDRRTLTNYIRDRGYLNASVAPISVDFYDGLRGSDERRRHGPSVAPDNKLNNRVVLTVNVDAGERFYLGSVSFVGNTLATQEELTDAFAVELGDVFDNHDITKGIKDAQRILRNHGYPKAVIRRDMRVELADPAAGRDKNLVHLTLHVYEGKQYRVGRIDLDGNRVTKDPVLRRAVRTLPGELYNEDKVQESIRQLRRIGLFNTAPPNPLRIDKFYDPSRIDEVDLRVRVEELGTGEIRANAAFSSVENFIFQLSYSERNFDILGLFKGKPRGGGQRFSSTVSLSEQRTNYNISWTNPHLYDGPYSLSYFINQSETSLSTADWDEDRFETGLTLGRRFFDNDLLLSVGYTFSTRLIDNVDSDAPDDALAAEGDRFKLNTITLRQAYDRLDVPRQPTSGWKIESRQSISGGPLSSTDEFYEIAFNFDIFFPMATSELGGVTTLHIGQENRWLESLDDDNIVPFYRRYRGGGPAPRHRGYEAGRLGPRELNINGEPTRPGGNTYWMTTAELIHPLQGVNQGIHGILFYDLGYVWADDEDNSLGELRSAAGFGIRFPMQFPIALDFAWRLDDKDNEDDTQFHFSIGGIF